jgi:Zn finger protein HypA/HybF involved in hydrogenase expression
MEKPNRECKASHTAYQPHTSDEWICPECGGPNMVVDEVADDIADDCDLIHEDDLIICPDCGYGDFGKMVTKRLQKLANLVTCPYCKGKGVIPKQEIKLKNLLKRQRSQQADTDHSMIRFTISNTTKKKLDILSIRRGKLN